MKDGRYCYGANCTWHGPISEAGNTAIHAAHLQLANRTVLVNGRSLRHGDFPMPCCPVCGGMLLEYAEPGQWWKQVDAFEAKGHPNYRAMLEWQRERKSCFRTVSQLMEAYKQVTGVEVAL